MAERSEESEAYHLADYAREWAQQAYRDEQSTFATINSLAAALDEPVERGSAAVLPVVEQILMLPWLLLPHERRQHWVSSCWRMGVQRNAWAVWLQLLREACADDHEHAALWLGRAICARWLGEWHESAASFQWAITHASQQREWGLLAEARLERSILLRLRGQFEQAAHEQEIVIDLARRYGDPVLGQRARCERAQIELERQDGEAALAWLHDAGESSRGLLLRGEAYLLLRDFQRGRQQIEAALPLLGDDQVGRAKAHALFGRLLYVDKHLDEARSQFDTAIILLQPTDDEYGLSRVYGNLAALLVDIPKPDYGEAFELLDRCEELQRRLGDQVALAVTRHNREYLVSRLGDDG
jgi:tetratricopeptide (TPR) repeat protein